MGPQPREPNILPNGFVLPSEAIFDDFGDLLGVVGVEPHLDILRRQYDRHAVMDSRQLGRGLLGEYNHLILVGIQPGHHQVILLFGLEHEWLVLLLPLKIPLHQYHAPVFDEL